MISSIPCKRRSLTLLSTLRDLLFHYHTTTASPACSFTLTPSSYQNPKSSTDSPRSTPSLPTTSVEFTPITVLETLSSYANDWQRALEFFKWVQTQCGFHHTTETYNRLIDILGKFFEFETCWDLIANMRISECSSPNHVTFRIMFKRYVSAHMINEAIDMFHNKLPEYNLKDELSFSNLIDALCEYKHVIEAEELCFKEKKNGVKDLGFDVSTNTKIYNMILRGWFKLGWWRKCREFWQEMDDKGVEKDLYSYSIYMNVLCKSGKPWKAVKLYKEMKKKGIKLDAVAYNSVIHAIGISDGVDFAVRLFKEMIELGCQPNVVTYNTILKLYCENGRYREAYRMLDDMCKKGCDPNVLTFHSLFGSLEKPKEILDLFDKMIEIGVRPQMETYVMLMRKFGRWGFLRPVLTVWRKIEEHGLSPDEFAYNALIDALVQKGMIDLARQYDNEMLAKGLSAKPRVELGTKPATVTGA